MCIGHVQAHACVTHGCQSCKYGGDDASSSSSSSSTALQKEGGGTGDEARVQAATQEQDLKQLLKLRVSS